ncbi:hypothetical protein Mzhil_0122 [Methanosalsum zhilinae DSM 4017]|uniref:Uncharacterized protein n=1 Tax=Methanosalsum zhilinae (strain DSM 4017 / NBRC 107636 / OCM 62 / WeN5) TaxID=679901 RepID=F7XL57_METZD|nr:hypothetical protein [Methanosalsum zhilinae]AEH60002.1 hypothetical protein Mzhil_0122 [Methanosalsum zhilinae DSM 4017]
MWGIVNLKNISFIGLITILVLFNSYFMFFVSAEGLLLMITILASLSLFFLDNVSADAGLLAIIGVLSVIFGAYTLKENRKTDAEKIRIYRTISYIEEFYSKQFMFHRTALSNLNKRVENGGITTEDIACRFVYSYSKKGPKPHFYGKLDGLTEHQHLSMYLSFLQRLYISIESGHIDLETIKKAIADAMIWHAELTLDVCNSIIKLAGEDCNGETIPEKQKDIIRKPADMVIKLHNKIGLNNETIKKTNH